MWSRGELKSRARQALSNNYWCIVLVGVIMMLVTGGLGSSSMGRNNNVKQSFRTVFDEGSSYTVQSQNELSHAMKELQSTLDQFSVGMFIGVGIAILIVSLIVIAIGVLIKALILNPLQIGCKRFMSHSLVEKSRIGEVSYVFDRSHMFMNVVKVMFLKDLFNWLWYLLFFFPGVVKKYEYMMIPYLMGENPEMTYQEAFAKSREMMQGNKWNAFVLDLSFIGWAFLAVMTCGIAGIFYVFPYMYLTEAALFRHLMGIQQSYDPNGTDHGYNNSTVEITGADTSTTNKDNYSADYYKDDNQH